MEYDGREQVTLDRCNQVDLDLRLLGAEADARARFASER
jgi:hypothetical protein